jgi:hypothetical protein
VSTSRTTRRTAAIGDDGARSRCWRAHEPLFAVGGASIIAGGLTAAVTGPTGWGHGSWTAAFLVLVAGAAQVGLGAGQAHLAPQPDLARLAAVQCVLWNAGCLLVIAGTLRPSPAVTSIGGAPLVATLVMSAWAIRRGARPSRLALAHLVLLTVLLVSIPIGMALAWSRH